jgi:tRNA-binding protein
VEEILLFIKEEVPMKTVSYNDFKQLDIRIVKVIKAESIPKKSKILKLVVDVGSDETRIIIAGGAEFFSPEQFLGKKYVALINLAPRKIAEIESQGMLLAAVSGEKPLWLTVDDSAPIGAKVI